MNKQQAHVMILEDNEPDLVLIKTSIVEAGVKCDITEFDDGAAALQYVSSPISRVPDLMILDFNVPGVEGTVVLNGVRGKLRRHSVGADCYIGLGWVAHCFTSLLFGM